MMYTLARPRAGPAPKTRSCMLRTSSMPRWLAASISMRSRARPSLTSVQKEQVLSGSPSFGPFAGSSPSQFSALARMRAAVVFPVPRGPQNRYACATRPWLTACRSVCTTASCPDTSAKRWGRHFL